MTAVIADYCPIWAEYQLQ